MPPKKQKTELGRQSNRLIAQQPLRTFDEAAKRRRIQKQLETLEKDNFHEDPHANISWHKAAPKFDDEMVFAGREEGKRRKKKPDLTGKVGGAEHATKKGKKLVAALAKTRFRKSFVQLLEEAERKREEELRAATGPSTSAAAARRGGTTGGGTDSPSVPYLTYTQITAPPSRLPPRKFCAVCGLHGCYTCVKCAAHFCSITCRDTHQDTRCLKWTV